MDGGGFGNEPPFRNAMGSAIDVTEEAKSMTQRVFEHYSVVKSPEHDAILFFSTSDAPNAPIIVRFGVTIHPQPGSKMGSGYVWDIGVIRGDEMVFNDVFGYSDKPLSDEEKRFIMRKVTPHFLGGKTLQ